jgi:pantoate--beta-alanine ligase
MTFTGRGATGGSPSPFLGAACAIDGGSERTLDAARGFAEALGMRPVRVPAERRPLYHAAASVASNFLITLEGVAERLAAACAVDRAMLAPLVRTSVENWLTAGFHDAITGPIARGDEATVATQRAAVAGAAPDLLPLWDALADATRAALRRADGSDVPSANGLRIERTVAGLRAAVDEARRTGHRVGFVPTMGALHEGHLSLIRRARAECGFVVTSLFVNPTQFNDPRDLEAYPRDEAGDAAMAAGAGTHLLFAPPVEEVYPRGFATTVKVSGITEPLEGAARGAAHFRGVATVVSRLFNLVRPDVAYFGQKDAQQALVIRRLAADLGFPLRVEVCPTIREPDGLALSSRNVHLSPEARRQATGLSASLRAIERAAKAGERSTSALLALGRATLGDRGTPADDVEYLAVVDAESLEALEQLTPGRAALVAIAARVGGVRLIDNVLVTP